MPFPKKMGLTTKHNSKVKIAPEDNQLRVTFLRLTIQLIKYETKYEHSSLSGEKKNPQRTHYQCA